MISPRDLQFSTIPPQRTGGQSVGNMPLGVMVKHLPTGLIAICEHERSQMRNRDTAIAMIERGIELLTHPTEKGTK